MEICFSAVDGRTDDVTAKTQRTAKRRRQRAWMFPTVVQHLVGLARDQSRKPTARGANFRCPYGTHMYGFDPTVSGSDFELWRSVANVPFFA